MREKIYKILICLCGGQENLKNKGEDFDFIFLEWFVSGS
jgi:hypothetical protein